MQRHQGTWGKSVSVYNSVGERVWNVINVRSSPSEGICGLAAFGHDKLAASFKLDSAVSIWHLPTQTLFVRVEFAHPIKTIAVLSTGLLIVAENKPTAPSVQLSVLDSDLVLDKVVTVTGVYRMKALTDGRLAISTGSVVEIYE